MHNNESKPLVAIILVNYKGIRETRQCLESLDSLTYKNHIIIVVDNASKDGNEVKLSEICIKHKAYFLESEKNTGFAGGNNIGIQKAVELGAEYFLLLNNDTLVEPFFLDYLVSVSKNDDSVGIVTALIMYYPDKMKIWYAGGEIDCKRQRAIHYGMKEQLSKKYLQGKEVDFVSGCCMLIPVSVTKDVGLLATDYFMYYEDMDYCLRMKQHGYKMIYEPKAKIYHCVSTSSGGEYSPFFVEWSNRSRRKIVSRYTIFSRTWSIICEIIEIVKIISNKNRKSMLRAYLYSYAKKELSND